MGGPTQPLDEMNEANVTKADTTAHDDKVRRNLAFTVFVSYMIFIVWVNLKPSMLPGDTLGMILGTLNTMSGLVIGYYFNSSSGSTAKQVAMEKKNA